MKLYTAPWSRSLIITSVLSVTLCVGVFTGALAAGSKYLGYFEWFPWALMALIPGAALFTIRGYVITPEAILVRRFFWNTVLLREGLRSAVVEPNAMKASIRTCGNGGFLSFTGWYWSRRLGAYRAFVTNGERTVVLRYDRKTFVLSPGDPDDFVEELGLPRVTPSSVAVPA